MTGSRKTITVVQGDYAVSKDPDATMSTVLGSCVAVCMFDASAKVGGMNHFLLASTQDNKNNDLKYGVNAMELLINSLLRQGASRNRLEAKVFGGARMTAHARDIGGSNAAFALDFLAKEAIPCRGQSIGGTSARRVQFHPTTGAARQMQVVSPAPEVIAPTPEPAPREDITLF